MSQSIAIACGTCQRYLVIGQSLNGRSLYPHRLLFRQSDDIDKLEVFLFKHEGHELEVGDLNKFDYEEDDGA